jgi:hypothetical protein
MVSVNVGRDIFSLDRDAENCDLMAVDGVYNHVIVTGVSSPFMASGTVQFIAVCIHKASRRFLLRLRTAIAPPTSTSY